MDTILHYQTIPDRCSACGRHTRWPSYSLVRISAEEMESYHRFLTMCKEAESATRKSMPSSPSKLFIRSCF
ncbi:guanine nucleotide exchange factor DBS isoform X1 [Tachysurus ichikawai]